MNALLLLDCLAAWALYPSISQKWGAKEAGVEQSFYVEKSSFTKRFHRDG